jgi:hypothetical protein
VCLHGATVGRVRRLSLSRGLWWKLLGLGGLAGVAASGAVVARAERRRRAYTPEEVRARLHERAAAVRGPSDPAAAARGT